MIIVRGLHNIKTNMQGCVATIGNFDGVHLGHQQLLQRTMSLAQQQQVPSVAITFEPHPAEYFNSANAPARLTRLCEKVKAIQRYVPLDYLLYLPFNRQLANLSPTEFIRTILINKLSIRKLLTGYDFQFGYQRQGNSSLLQQAGKDYGFSVYQEPPYLIQNQRVSSTLIRELLAAGEFESAKQMLGRAYSMLGRVVRGDQRGRQLGYPTANIYLKRSVSPLAGVYAVKVHGIQALPILGVANVGTRPTLDGTHSLLEVYLLDFNQNIYGYRLEVEFIAKIRSEYKFSSVGALIQRIEQDVEIAREILTCSVG